MVTVETTGGEVQVRRDAVDVVVQSPVTSVRVVREGPQGPPGGAGGGGLDQAAADARYVNVAGDTMAGDLTIQGDLDLTWHSITTVWNVQTITLSPIPGVNGGGVSGPDPVLPEHLATKGYVDARVGAAPHRWTVNATTSTFANIGTGTVEVGGSNRGRAFADLTGMAEVRVTTSLDVAAAGSVVRAEYSLDGSVWVPLSADCGLEAGTPLRASAWVPVPAEALREVQVRCVVVGGGTGSPSVGVTVVEARF